MAVKRRRRRRIKLAGLAEVAERLWISGSSVSARRRSPGFPQPLAELACGPVWDLDEIDDYELLRRGDPDDPDFFLNHPDLAVRRLELILREVKPAASG